MYHLSFAEIQAMAQAESGSTDTRRPLLPLYADILTDLETPVSAYCKTAQQPYSFLLESVAGGEHVARYSFLGSHPYLVMLHDHQELKLRYLDPQNSALLSEETVACHDPLTFIEDELNRYRLVTASPLAEAGLPKFFGGAVGYLGYESVARFERLPVSQKNEIGLPLTVFGFYETVLIFDHVKHQVRVITNLHLDAPDLEAEHQRVQVLLKDIQARLRLPARLPEEPAPFADPDEAKIQASVTREEFEKIVSRCVEYIHAGDIFQVVPSLRFSRKVAASPLTIYRALRTINPSPYMFFLDLGDFQIIGASPEVLVRVENRDVTIRPLAGTRPRGKSTSQDQQIGEELLKDEKERAEHVMLLDLARNDVGRVAVPGSIVISDFMEVERYSHVMHIVSNVKGKLRDDISPFDALRSGFPAGTVSGAPKIRAMEIINEMEDSQRGVYGGAVGWLGHNGNQETALALRTMVFKDGRAYVQSGCGVVADSDPAYEYAECMNKAGAQLRALDEAERLAQTYQQQATEV